MNRHFPALRGLAIAIVVLHHSIRMPETFSRELNYAAPAGWERFLLVALLQLGIFAVPTFLFISGSFFVYAAQGENPKLSYRTVWAGLKHLLWPYLFWSVIFYIIIYLGQGTTFTLPGYLWNLIRGYPFHFIPLLVFWYVVSPVLVRLSKRFGWLTIAVIVFYQFLLINLAYPAKLGLGLPDWMKYLAPPVLSGTMADWGVYFPLGVIYSLKARQVTPWLVKYKWVSAFLTVLLYVLSVLHESGAVRFPMAEFLAPLVLMCFLPTLRRDAIPQVRQLEKVGKRAYGLYLTNLIVLYLILLPVKALIPGVFHHYLWLVPFLFVLTLAIPLGLMSLLERIPARRAYPYVFG